MLSCFHRIPERDGQTDGQTDRFAISISRVSVLTRDKNMAHKSNCQVSDLKISDVKLGPYDPLLVLTGHETFSQLTHCYRRMTYI